MCRKKADISVSEPRDFYNIISNIDGSMMRHERVQTALSLLVQIDGIHIIAYIDHINASLSEYTAGTQKPSVIVA